MSGRRSGDRQDLVAWALLLVGAGVVTWFMLTEENPLRLLVERRELLEDPSVGSVEEPPGERAHAR